MENLFDLHITKSHPIRIWMLVVLSYSVSHFGYSQDSLYYMRYDFSIYNNYDLRNSSSNMIGTFRVLNDGFSKGISSQMKPKMQKVSQGIFSFATVYLGMLWSHELGHSLRARQVGGKFNIHDFGLPVPYTTADLPDNISLEDEAIFVTAGFEVNYLNVRKFQSEFVRNNGMSNLDLNLSFANRLMHTIYTSLVVPINPKDKDVWINTAGDPVHYMKPVWENYSSIGVFMPDSTVNPDLVSFYRQGSAFATFFQLLDPQFYRELGAAFGSTSKVRKPIFLIGDHENGWTYGTLYNASPLGYELYFQNYIHLAGQQFGLYAKYGRPFKNLGLGVSMNNVLDFDNFKSDVRLEFWEQDLFGNGVSVESQSFLKLTEHFGLNFSVGYKTSGYVLGKQLKAGPNLGFGFSYYRS